MRVRPRRRSERGATVPEYALLMGLAVLALVPATIALEDEAGSYLVATGDDIGQGRADPDPDEYTEPAAATPNWVEQTISYGPNLIGNGGFENPSIPNNAWRIISGTAWLSSENGDHIEIWESGHNGVASPEGTQHGELNLHTATTYSQTVSVTPGLAYRWHIYHRARRYTSEAAELVLNGNVVATLQSPFSWTSYSGTIVATSSTMTLEIRSLTGTGLGNLIDDVRLEEIQT
ncbi:MAG: hypothetical protein AAF547_09530 [Actinomycetota bacterium]